MDFKSIFGDLISKETNTEKSKILSLIELPPENLGDFAFPCFILSKELKKSPNAIATELATKLNSDAFEKIEANGPYVNAFVNRINYTQKVFTKIQIQEKTKRVGLEYMNANPNKPLHLGQARNICIGNSMIRIFKYLKYPIDGINYGDDTGVNVGYNIVGHLYYNIPLETKKKFDHFCGEVYTKMRKMDEDDNFKQKLSETLLAIEHGKDEKIMNLHEEYTKKCASAQFETCWRMNAFFDLVNWESDIIHLKLLEESFDYLKENNYVVKLNEGEFMDCYVMDLSQLEDFKGNQNKYQVIVKSDGVATYVAKDIAYGRWKLGQSQKDFHYDKLVKQPNGKIIFTTVDKETGLKTSFGNYDIAISVIDNRQDHPQKVVKNALKMSGLPKDKEYIHLSYGVVYITPKTLLQFGFNLTEEEKQEERLPFSSRKGWFITIDETLDKLKIKALEESKKRNPDQNDEWLLEVAEKIAVASLRFFLTKYDNNKDITFDIDAALDMEGETGAYVLYSYARISSIFSKANIKELPAFDYNNIIDDKSFTLMKKIMEFEDILEMTRKNLAPNVLCRYIIDLCQMFNSYYANVPILKSNEEEKSARLNLLAKLQETIKSSLELLGIEVVERM